jgi:four helix bundle protein
MSQTDSIVAKKSYLFALEVIVIYKILISEKKEFVLSKQFLRCGTAIGANAHEAISSESKKDFVHKLSISLKEARETSYWLNLLKDSNYLTIQQFEKLNADCNEIIKILNSIILTMKERYIGNNSKL